MPRRLAFVFCVLLGLSIARAQTREETNWVEAAKAAMKLPRETFFSLPEVRQPRLSPDGTKIAFLFPHEGKMALGLFDRSTQQARMVIEGKNESLYSFLWKGDDRLVFMADFEGNESFFVGATDLEGRRVLRIVETQPNEYVAGSAGSLVDPLVFDDDRILVSGIFRSSNRFGASSTTSDFVVAKVNVRNRGLSPLYTMDRSEAIANIVSDNDGVLRIRVVNEPNNGNPVNIWQHRETDNGRWHEIARFQAHGYVEMWTPLFFNANNTELYLVSRESHDRGALYTYNTTTGLRSEPLFIPPEGEITGLVMDRNREVLRGVVYESDQRHYHWFEAGADRARLQASIEAAFPGMEITFSSWSDDEQVALVHVGSDREAGVYFVLDRQAGSLDLFKRVREIPASLMRPMQPIAFESRDGLTIHGYLTLPWSAESGRPVPLIINPHGGPFGVRDEWGFNPEIQFLASRGYAILQVNYRGSGGYGVDFLNRGRRQWGRDMQNDLTDAVHWAIDQGYADPNRVAIYGASYGGYATLAGLIFTPELYVCGVNYVGASDLEITFKQRGADAYMRSDDFSYQRVWVGETKEYRDATSPVNHVDRISVPSLHAYGAKDPRVVIDHWTRLESELKRHGKIYESITERGQGHGFRNEEASLDFYGVMETFLARYLRPEYDVELGDAQVIELDVD